MKHRLKRTPVEHVCVPPDQPMSPKHFKNYEIGPGKRARAIFPNISAFYLEGSWHNLHSDVLVFFNIIFWVRKSLEAGKGNFEDCFPR